MRLSLVHAAPDLPSITCCSSVEDAVVDGCIHLIRHSSQYPYIFPSETTPLPVVGCRKS